MFSTTHVAGDWVHTFYSPPDADPVGRVVAAVTIRGDRDGSCGIHLGTGTDLSVIAACIELEAALANVRRQAQEHAAQGWMDLLVPEDVPLARPDALDPATMAEATAGWAPGELTEAYGS